MGHFNSGPFIFHATKEFIVTIYSKIIYKEALKQLCCICNIVDFKEEYYANIY